MNEQNINQIISVIDIGTTKIIALIAEYDLERNKINKIKGFGESESNGLKSGVVVNIRDTIKSIKKAVESAEEQANEEITEVFVGISGDHIKGMNYSGVAPINSEYKNQATGHSIDKDDIDRVLEHAKSINCPPDRRIMHVLPQQYIVDAQEGIKEPLGLSGHRLEAKVHLVTSSINTETDIATCLNELDIDIMDFILEPLASSYSVLSKDERELGSILIDIGGGTTDIITYGNGSVLHTGVIPIGGTIMTKDIAYRVQTSIDQAEKLKHIYGKAKIDLASDKEDIVVKGVGGRNEYKISEKILSEVIEPRIQEIFELVKIEIEKSDYKGDYTFGIILTGGGSKLSGIKNLVHNIFNIPVKVGSPIYDFEIINSDVEISDPRYATSIGLVKYAGEHFEDYKEGEESSIFQVFKNFFKKITNNKQ